MSRAPLGENVSGAAQNKTLVFKAQSGFRQTRTDIVILTQGLNEPKI